MSVILKYNKTEYNAHAILWDRDSYFIDFNNYWSRLAGSIAQKIAESTTDNWNKFNLVRTQSIKALGINPETGIPEPSSSINNLPTNIYPFLLASALKDILNEKKLDELNSLFQALVAKALDETKHYIKAAIITKNLEILKSVNKKTKQIIITNDSEENNGYFIKEAGLTPYLFKSISNINKEQLSELSNENFVLITKNKFLHDSYLKKNIKNVLCIEETSLLSFKETNDTIKINIDGASKGNPGPSAIGIVFYKENEIINEVSEFIGNQTNNFAEYTALIRALEISEQNGYENIEIRSDSELVVKQINKIYKVKDPDIKDLFNKVNALMEKFSSVKITHIPREENSKADKLANIALKNQLLQ